MGKFLHIVDDEKFIDSAYRVFEKTAPGAHIFVIFKKGKKLEFIKETPVKVYSPWRFLLYRFFPFLMPRSDKIILHNLNLPKIRYLQCLTREARVCWLGWGFDYYDLIGKELLKSETKTIANAPKNISIMEPIRVLRSRMQYGFVKKDRVIGKIDYFAPVIHEDHVLVRESVPDFGPEYVDWNYGTLEDDLIRGFEDQTASGPNILVGNSATAPNNHLEAFSLLRTIELGERKIIAPLSYGDDNYREIIIERGYREFGGSFLPLVEFMPIDEYVKTISSCSIVIMNHLRQQALGNLVIMLHLGAKVFLDSKNPVYSFMKRKGVVIYPLEELGTEIDSHLSADQIGNNRQILRSVWARKVALQKTRALIEKLEA